MDAEDKPRYDEFRALFMCSAADTKAGQAELQQLEADTGGTSSATGGGTDEVWRKADDTAVVSLELDQHRGHHQQRRVSPTVAIERQRHHQRKDEMQCDVEHVGVL